MIAARLMRTEKKEGVNRSNMMLFKDFKLVYSIFLPCWISLLLLISDCETDCIPKVLIDLIMETSTNPRINPRIAVPEKSVSFCYSAKNMTAATQRTFTKNPAEILMS
jgi:hypothetical protein